MNNFEKGIFKFYKNFCLYNDVGIHTAEFNIKVTRNTFMDIYCKNYSFMKAMNNKDHTKFSNLEKDFPNASYYDTNSIFHKEYGKYPTINLTNGIRVEFSIAKEFGNFKIIADPILFMESRSRKFRSEEYNYLQISPLDYDFWKKFVETFKAFLMKWKVPKYLVDKLKPSRVDFCANIRTDKNFPIKKYFKYMRIMPKYYRFNDKNKSIGILDLCQCSSEKDLKRKSRYENMVKFGNSAHSITLYDKIVEQRDVHGRSYPGIYLIRIEYQPERAKIQSVVNKMIDSGCFGEEFKKWYDPNSYGEDLVKTLHLLSKVASFAILMAITEFFPTEHICSKKKTYSKISKIKCSDKIKNLMYKFVDIMSANLSHDAMKNSIKDFKNMYGCYSYYKVIHLLYENNIAPVYLADSDKTFAYHTYPSIRDMYLSAVQNACDERKMN